jgi:hypothetical protein
VCFATEGGFGCDGLESLSGLGFRIELFVLFLSGGASFLSLFSCCFELCFHLERIVALESNEPEALETRVLLKAGRAQCPL